MDNPTHRKIKDRFSLFPRSPSPRLTLTFFYHNKGQSFGMISPSISYSQPKRGPLQLPSIVFHKISIKFLLWEIWAVGQRQVQRTRREIGNQPWQVRGNRTRVFPYHHTYTALQYSGYFAKNLSDSSRSLWDPWWQEQLLFMLVFIAHSTELAHNRQAINA